MVLRSLSFSWLDADCRELLVRCRSWFVIGRRALSMDRNASDKETWAELKIT